MQSNLVLLYFLFTGLVWRAERPPARYDKDGTINKRKFVCVLCGAAYSHAKSLNSHLRYHTGETECYLCHKVLSRKTHVTRHLMMKHGIYTPGPRSKKPCY
ncbi:hypothetical protein C0J52_01364 [Blattella germanica]|nr:hypothetical protein C0J52_01364 [Blattella germanica]